MIYGLIPIGGQGLRLGLPYSKEMLPQKNYDFYNPIVNHLVEKMSLAGAGRIVFVHGNELKQDVCKYFSSNKYLHLKQTIPGFATVIKDFYHNVELHNSDKILFGLPDSVFDKNPYVEMLLYPGIVCGLFSTTDNSKVDRLDMQGCNFQVKIEKNDSNQNLFWGILKFDHGDICQMINKEDFSSTTEIGDILNRYPKKFVIGKKYLDLGTWQNYNRYLSDEHRFSNVEIEKKYSAKNIKDEDFIRICKEIPAETRYEFISSMDFYFTNSNPAIEFIRYREGTKDTDAVPDITIKNFNQSQLNRFELVIPLGLKNDRTQDVIHFLSLLNLKFEFSVHKNCHIFYFVDFTLVLYSFTINNEEFRILEIELNKSNFNMISNLEKIFTKLPGFDSSDIITVSKFQLIKDKLKNDSAY